MVVCPACNSRYDEGIQFCPRDGTHVVNDNSGDEVGKVLADRYKVLRKLGEGGMGEVYEAQHVYIEKRFALKLLRKEIMTNKEAVTRFYQEARAASAIGHENIVEIDDFGHLPDGRAYLAMEFLEGQSLADAAREQIAIARSVEITCQVCRGLAAAHAKGIIHRDMKPENVFLVRRAAREVAKILDFGIAKVSGADGSGQSPSLTRTGTIFGTPHYMSPEQALGKPLDHRTDIYSVGVIMYEIFAGMVPFRGESFMAILTQHITAAPLPPRDVAPERGIPPEVERVILRAMAKEPGERFTTMAQMHDELARIQRELFGGARPPTPLPTTPPPGYAATMAAVSGVTPAPSATAAPPAPAASAARKPTSPTLGARPSSVVAAPPLAEPEPELVVRRSRAPLVILLLLVIAGGGGAGGWYYYTHQSSVGTPTPVAGPPVAPPSTPTPIAKAPLMPPDPETPPAPRMVSVLLDTVPRGAAIIRDGRRVSDTPEQIDVADGSTLELELHRDGYRDTSVTLDPQKQHKVLVRLERARKGEEHHHAAMPPPPAHPKAPPPPHVGEAPPQPPVVEQPPPEPIPTEPPPAVQPPPVLHPPPVRTGPHPPVVVPPRPIIPPKKPPKKKDPYERLDKIEEPLDPYK